MKKISLIFIFTITVFTVMAQNNIEKATLGGGCFWCVEAVFEEVEGIKNVSSGYMGGHVKNPTYREVTSGRSGHAFHYLQRG